MLLLTARACGSCSAEGKLCAELQLLSPYRRAFSTNFRLAVKACRFYHPTGGGLWPRHLKHTRWERSRIAESTRLISLTVSGKFTHDNLMPPSEDPARVQRRLSGSLDHRRGAGDDAHGSWRPWMDSGSTLPGADVDVSHAMLPVVGVGLMHAPHDVRCCMPLVMLTERMPPLVRWRTVSWQPRFPHEQFVCVQARRAAKAKPAPELPPLTAGTPNRMEDRRLSRCGASGCRYRRGSPTAAARRGFRRP